MDGWANNAEHWAYRSAFWKYLEQTQPADLPSKVPEHHKKYEKNSDKNLQKNYE